MSDPDYRFDRQGGEPPLTMDDHRQRRPRGPAPVTLIVSLLLLLGVGGGVLYMYRSGVKSADTAARPLGTPLGAVRAPAQDPGPGLSNPKDDPGAGVSVPTLAAPPEEPLPSAPAAVAAPVPPTSAAPPPSAPSAVPNLPAAGAAVVPPPPPPPSDAASTAPLHRPPVRPDARPQSIDQLLARPDGATAGRMEKAKSDGSKSDRTRPDKTNGEPAARGPVGAVLIQIGAFSSQRLADEEWSKAAAIAPGVMAGKGKRVVPVVKDGNTLYRTSITGFMSRVQATALCDRLKAAGGRCFVH